MSEENERLARTTCGELNYANMKDKVMKIFGDFTTTGTDHPSLPIKQEAM